MNNLEDRIRGFNDDMRKKLEEVKRELAVQNAIKVLETSYKANLISPETYHKNLESMYRMYFKD